MLPQNYKYLFFDLDNTLTPSRTPITDERAGRLRATKKQLIVVSGSTREQIQSQISDIPAIILAQNGNHATDPNTGELWYDPLLADEKEEIHAHIQKIRDTFTHTVPDENDLIQDRGSQISFSIYGHHADTAAKKAFDGNFERRKAFLKQHPFVSEAIDVQMGGNTNFDYFKRGHTKGYNVQRLIELYGWDPRTCIYFGDALFPGGNDSSVVGVIDTVQVTNEDDTFKKLDAYL